MLFVLLALIVFVFLVIGSIAFLVCVLLPPTRRFALSAALWFAVWGPCSVGLMVLAGLGLAGGALAMKAANMHWTDAPRMLGALGWSYMIVGTLITIGVATGAAWLHQWLIHRFTFALFRIYVTAISAGIGSVFGWWLGWWIMAQRSRPSGRIVVDSGDAYFHRRGLEWRPTRTHVDFEERLRRDSPGFHPKSLQGPTIRKDATE